MIRVQGYNDFGVVIATKWRHYPRYLQPYFSVLGTVPSKSFTGAFSFNSRVDVRDRSFYRVILGWSFYVFLWLQQARTAVAFAHGNFMERTSSVRFDQMTWDHLWTCSILTSLVISAGWTEMSEMYPSYKNNNQTRGGLGRICATRMYLSIGHVDFPKFQSGICVEWKVLLIYRVNKSKPVSQVFVSKQSATTLLRARENIAKTGFCKVVTVCRPFSLLRI